MMMESVCNDTIMAAWASLQDATFAMWDDLSTIAYIFFGVLAILILINIFFAAYVFFSLPSREGT